HGTHLVLRKNDATSPTFARNIPQLCGKCHRAGEDMAVRKEGGGTVEHYTMSIHGKGLLDSGLLVSAVCTSCHASHLILPADNARSKVHPANIGETCAECHLGVFEQFRSSIHSPEISKTNEKLPICNDCHDAHSMVRVDQMSFRQQIFNQCGDCHEYESSTYFDTYHGKVSLLKAEGSEKTAKCSDCHGAHNVLPVSDPNSTLSRDNAIETCKKCHPNSNRQFTGYLSHATHHNRHKYPILFYTFWSMTTLLVVTFLLFGVHTLLWLPRSFAYRFKIHQKLKKQSKSYYVRFSRVWRILHVVVIISFFSLVVTGMLLKFAGTQWAEFFARLLGGFENAGLIHRAGAIVTFLYFAVHFYYVYQNWKRSGKSLRQFIFDKQSGLAPHRIDFKEFFSTLRWFFTGKNRPDYGRWTYWEKFDYLAVFWGVTMIGFTGLILWFPEFFTKFFPGWIINVATIVHSDEALLATGFIFTFHFFNTHFRPEKFPMDPVIFTGKVPLEEFKLDRPREYEMVKKQGLLRKKLEKEPSKKLVFWSHIFGICCLLFGYMLVAMIIYAMIFQYK
ncbi:MAG: cytochrome c3 family protein, partial [bacterium]|nr:cytochrome c3 family protein [bacterium]